MMESAENDHPKANYDREIIFEEFQPICKMVQESHAVAGKPRDAAVNSDRYQQPVGQKQSEWETENIT